MTLPEPLLDRTFRLVKASGLSYRKIAAGSGEDLSWVAKFCQGNIAEPGVKKVQAVHDFLVAYLAASNAPARKRRVNKAA